MSEIIAQKNGRLNDDDRLELIRLLGKAGYIVWLGRRKKDANGNYVNFVGFVEPEKADEIGKHQ